MVANPAPIGVLERASGCESAAGPGQGSGAAEDRLSIVLLQPDHICGVFSNSNCLVSQATLEPARGDQALQSRNNVARGVARSGERRARVAERTLCR